MSTWNCNVHMRFCYLPTHIPPGTVRLVLDFLLSESPLSSPKACHNLFLSTSHLILTSGRHQCEASKQLCLIVAVAARSWPSNHRPEISHQRRDGGVDSNSNLGERTTQLHISIKLHDLKWLMNHSW